MVQFPVSTAEGAQSLLSDDEWQWASQHLPIACVDILPIRRSSTGRTTHVGLIRRDSPMGQRWCHLGGRVWLGESLADAATRHLQDSITETELSALAPGPYFVNQYFQTPRPGMGLDPRKHAIASCYLAEFPGESHPIAHGVEALEFQWFAMDNIPSQSELWPGTRIMIDRPEVEGSWADELLAYEALNARYISHNEMMWQTPVLAMTAMAFLLTIALGQGENWMRSLAALLSSMIALISAQLMVKHSASQISDAEDLLRFELRRNMPPIHARPVYAPTPFTLRPGGLRNWFASKRSRVWWFNALLALGLVSAGISLQALIAIFV
jgi:ADP-ribose pyrophosphatase YjhB (NUDIX family)